MKRSVKTIKNVIADETFSVGNYPACKLFFPVTETSGTSLTDVVGNVVSDFELRRGSAILDGSLTFAGGGALLSGGASSKYGTLESGTMPTLGAAKHSVAIIVADFGVSATDTLALGSPEGTEAGIRTLFGVTAVIHDDTTNDSVTATLPDTNSEAVATVFQRTTGEFHLLETDGTTPADAGTPDTVLDVAGAVDLSLNSGTLVMTEDIKLYGACIFDFTDEPTIADVLQSMSWCNYQWRNNNKVLPPMWKNRT